MPKIKIKIVEIRKEPHEKTGKMLYRVFVESGGKIYRFGVRESDYLNDKLRESIHRTWLKSIRADRFPPLRSKTPEETIKEVLQTEIEEDPYDRK
jgi:hypothetical protein